MRKSDQPTYRTAVPRISRDHSINRVKRTLAKAEQYNTRRAASLRIACKSWLGVWGR